MLAIIQARFKDHAQSECVFVVHTLSLLRFRQICNGRLPPAVHLCHTSTTGRLLLSKVHAWGL